MASLLGSQGRANVVEDVLCGMMGSLLIRLFLHLKAVFLMHVHFHALFSWVPCAPNCRSPLDPISCSSHCARLSFPIRKQQLEFSMALASHPST